MLSVAWQDRLPVLAGERAVNDFVGERMIDTSKTIGWTGLFVACLLACGPAPKGGSDGGGGSGGTNCTLPGTIGANMELTTACPVWHIASSGTTVEGSGNPVLTIDKGVTIAIDKGGFLSIGTGTGSGTAQPGGIQAVGTASAPITFTSCAAIPAAGDWSAVVLADDVLAGSTIAFAKFEFGGGGSPSDGYSYDEPPAELIVYGGTNSVPVLLHDLEFAHTGGNGLVYDNFKAGFATGSANLKVDDVATGDEPFVVAANQASTIPTSISGPAGTAVDLILGQGYTQGGTGGTAVVAVTQTWPALPLPYLADGNVKGSGSGLQIEGANNSTATLTIAAPNTIQFMSGGSLTLDPDGTGQAVLLAIGTPAAPIVFTSNLPSPSPGAWDDLILNAPSGGGGQLGATTLQGVKIQYAGSGGQAINLLADTGGSAGPVISGCAIEDYPATSCGIEVSHFITPPTGGYDTPVNSFSGSSTVCTP